MIIYYWNCKTLKTPSMTSISKAYFASSFYPRSPVIGIYLLYCKTGSRYWFTSGGAPVVTQSGVKMWSPWNQMRRDQKIETSQQISNKTSPSRARAKTEAKTKAKAKPTVKTLSTAVRCTSVCGGMWMWKVLIVLLSIRTLKNILKLYNLIFKDSFIRNSRCLEHLLSK